MLNGWYRRSLANEEAAQQNDAEPNEDSNYDTDSDSQDDKESPPEVPNTAIDYESKYRRMKRKFKYLIYENEFFQNALHCNHRRLLKVSRDRAFLLDRLLHYEKTGNTSSDSEATMEYSEADATNQFKRQKLEKNGKSATYKSRKVRKKHIAAGCDDVQVNTEVGSQISTADATDEIQHAQADVAQQLLNCSRIAFSPECDLAMVPTEICSHEHLLYSVPNTDLDDLSSPIHVAAEECVPMEYRN